MPASTSEDRAPSILNEPCARREIDKPEYDARKLGLQ
jgi:uncharacterized membrane protein